MQEIFQLKFFFMNRSNLTGKEEGAGTAVNLPGRQRGGSSLRMILLFCGLLSSVLYIAMNIFVPMMYPGYNAASQAVSELSAVGAPTRETWVWLGNVYTALIGAFGLGILLSARPRKPLRITGILLLVHAAVDIFWSFAPMHQREALEAGGGTLEDTLHIVISGITVLLMLLMMGFGAAAFGKKFRVYSIASIIVFLLFLVLTGIESPRIAKNLPTPWLGVWERIVIGAFMIWLLLLSVLLIRREKKVAGL